MTSATSLTQQVLIGPVDPDVVFLLLTDPTITPSFFNRCSFRCDNLEAGAPYALVAGETIIADGTIETYQPLTSIEFTFRQRYDATNTDPPGRVRFHLTTRPPLCQLTIVHEGLTPGSAINADFDDSWLIVASSLKTLIESDRVMPLTVEEEQVLEARAKTGNGQTSGFAAPLTRVP